ncbi:CaiB/BaiF CoA transferase family protein [Paenarthrobacter nicotinovorans]|uniref:CaiB/BaiF CoA transferase family protein n=1 Tax=Paenarthrobacter nicotinovorans TaxID=29320 RepID=UPI0016647EBA|nr:CoA transferase [Paenarthrobacter nicotinovorans]MBP2393567.1 formyl-CoA transferase [Paenarthrobacter nicotinovorans]UKF00181.1 CoA transferase [Paenarthrobacter nicotinovorans]UKF04963.1 CoA transferase [Paenarthrobacter nicotinovorans]GGV33219.1 CoA transferase [Paenarthrobacter nicotinovorans]
MSTVTLEQAEHTTAAHAAESRAPMRLPLDGIKIVDFTQVFMGPSCTQLLGDYGADIIKVERPGAGDISRNSFPDQDGQDNPIFLSINRNKRSVSVDTRTDEGREVLHRLMADADVVVSNFRSGVMERMGFGYEELKEKNPGIIWASGTGFGPEGPYSHKGGQDAIAQAYSGVMWRRESEDAKPAIYPTTLCDYITGMHLMQGILLALRTRETSGTGQKVEVTMYDSMLHLQMQEACMQLNRGYEVNWGAMPLSGVFETTNGAVCMVGGFTPDPLARISNALDLDEDLTERPGFATLEQQFKNKPALQAIFREHFATNTTEYWTAKLEEQGLLNAPVHTLEQALADAQTEANGMIVEAEHPTVGTVKMLNAPIRLSATPPTIRRTAPRLGEHNVEVLLENGFDEETIERLQQLGVLR